MRPPIFNELWALAGALAPERGTVRDVEGAFDNPAVGLILRPDEGRMGYEATPLNSDTFAHTGGDGVHFGFLHVTGPPERWPIVMTVPMSLDENANTIVGADLLDFLALGCRFGYFALEQLVYDRDGTIARIQGGQHACGEPDGAHLLAAIRHRFHLRPWSDVAGKLTQLREQFFHQIRL